MRPPLRHSTRRPKRETPRSSGNSSQKTCLQPLVRQEREQERMHRCARQEQAGLPPRTEPDRASLRQSGLRSDRTCGPQRGRRPAHRDSSDHAPGVGQGRRAMANGGAPHDPPDAAQTLEARDSVSPGFPRRDRSQSDRTGCAGGIPFRRAGVARTDSGGRGRRRLRVERSRGPGRSIRSRPELIRLGSAPAISARQ